MVGMAALRSLLDGATAAPTDATVGRGTVKQPTLDCLIDQLAVDGRGLIMCMGKGGVGKTTVASAIATRLAELGHRVHLTTTDPAGHLESTIGEEPGSANLTLSRVDPVQAVADYRAHVMDTKGKSLDEAGRAVLAEDLMSPCTEEVAVFQQFSRLVNQARRSFVVMDTAPTGHTLLLMDAAGSYHREIVRNMPTGTEYTTPMMRLQDPDYTNQSLAVADTTSPLLRHRASQEQGPIEAVRRRAQRLALVPLLEQEPIGHRRLALLAS